mgnify:CR=1 FL=1
MSQYVSRFTILVTDNATNRTLGLFTVHMKVTMNQESFNDFVNIANDSLSELLNRTHRHEGVEGSYTEAEQVYALDEVYQRIRNFFGEDADLVLDRNLEWYGMENTIEHIRNFIEPIVELQIFAIPTWVFVELAEGRQNEIQNAFIRTNVMA